MNGTNYSDDSDDSDVDYVPTGREAVLSEEDSDEFLKDDEVAVDTVVEREGKRKKKTSKSVKKPCISQPSVNIDKEEEHKSVASTEIADMKKADSLWSEFMNNRPTDSVSGQSTSKAKVASEKDSVTVEQVFEFAGEEVRVVKQVPKNYIKDNIHKARKKPGVLNVSAKGLPTVLGNLGRKIRIGTLEKSKLDWDNFKNNTGIANEIKMYNQGKNGYLDKLDFLERADQRQYQVERGIRNITQ